MQRAVQPQHYLSEALDSLASASNVSPPWLFKVLNEDGDQLNLTPQRMVGTQPLTVEVEASPVHSLEAKVEHQGSDLAELEQGVTELRKELLQLTDWMMASAEIHLMTCSAQILKTALGAPFIHTCSRQVQAITTDPVVVRLAGLAVVTPTKFALQADQLIDRRNNTATHQSSCTQLEANVAACQALMTPALRQKHKWES